MTILQQRQYDRFGRSVQFLDAHQGEFASGSRALALRDDLKQIIASLDATGKTQGSKPRGKRGFTSAKQIALNALREELVAIARTAETIAQHDSSFKNTYTLPDKRRKEELVKAAAQFAKEAEKNKKQFAEYEMPSDFLETLQARVDNYKAAQAGDPTSAPKGDGSVDEQGELAKSGVRLIDNIDVIVRNKFRGNTDVLSEWAAASKVESPPRKRRETKKSCCLIRLKHKQKHPAKFAGCFLVTSYLSSTKGLSLLFGRTAYNRRTNFAGDVDFDGQFRDANRAGNCVAFGRAVTDDAGAIHTQQNRAAVAVVIETRFHAAKRGRQQERGEFPLRRTGQSVFKSVHEQAREAFSHFQNDVADETVAHDHIDRSLGDIAASTLPTKS
jgi:hypothetical protein